MTRILYAFFSEGGLQGGHKMILRHVETLRELGFDAAAYTGDRYAIPDWFEHRVPIIRGKAVRADDVFVMPDDAVGLIPALRANQTRLVALAQNHFYAAASHWAHFKAFAPGELPPFLVVSPSVERLLRRVFPQAEAHLVRAFADERRFRPAAVRAPAIAVVPRKRPAQATAIRNLFPRLHPRHADLDWRWLDGVGEAEVARGLSDAALSLSLNRLEGLGMTTLEAMASGAICAGFTGGGGRDYATPANGFWAEDDDIEAAVDALAAAADLFKAGGPELVAMQAAARETARAWSHAAFRRELEAAWMRLAPDARRRDGPVEDAAG